VGSHFETYNQVALSERKDINCYGAVEQEVTFYWTMFFQFHIQYINFQTQPLDSLHLFLISEFQLPIQNK